MNQFDILFPMPEVNRNSDDMGIPVQCDCGKADLVVFPSGETRCGETLKKFELIHGRPYKPCDNWVSNVKLRGAALLRRPARTPG